MIVMKFGGTSVAGAAAISNAIDIIKSRLDKTPVVVVSAMSGITDLLYRIADRAQAKDGEGASALLEELRERHITTAETLLDGSVDLMLQATSAINGICDTIESHVGAIAVLGELTSRSRAIIVSNGEILSSTIISFAMNASGIRTALVDAREMITTRGDNMKGEPDMIRIYEDAPRTIAAALAGQQAVITQGFVARNVNGEPSVLGRGGSDYSASMIGAAISAEAIEIWTDVDGVLTADPRMVPNAKPLERISFEEAAEMAHFGAKVLHPLTIEPAVRRNIPISVLNSKRPEYAGTLILPGSEIADGVKSVSFKENIQVINIFSTKMINVSGFLGSVFEVFGRHKVSVDLISTSEASISVTVDGSEDVSAIRAELSGIAAVEVDTNKAQISVVGKNVGFHDDVMKKVSAALYGSPVFMLSQGASHINISVVIEREALPQMVSAIHDNLFA